MSNWENLKFDKMETDTRLAQKYFEKNLYMFPCIVHGVPAMPSSTPSIILEEYNISLFYLHDSFFITRKCPSISTSSQSMKLRELANKLEMNEELFCQLEYALRKKPADDVKKDLYILINKILDLSSVMLKYQIEVVTDEYVGPYEFAVTATSPIYYLFCSLSQQPTIGVKIVAMEKLVPICTLFIDLCREVGLHHAISLQIEPSTYIPLGITSPAEGCLGVVTETADLDSAIHAFVSSTTVNPWRVNVVLVQENVYEQFKMALKGRCSINSSNETYEPHLTELSADTQVAGGKIFLIDYLGTGRINSKLHPIVISAYRTNKELIKMIFQYEEPFVSLWCSDSAHANEIAFSISSPCVWINSHGVFNGSPRVASALPFCRIDKEIDSNINYDSWLKLDVGKRRDVIHGVLQKIIDDNENTKFEALKIQGALSNRPGFVELGESDIWIGVEKPLGKVYVSFEDNDFFLDALASIVYGNRILVKNVTGFFIPLVEALKMKDVPIEVGYSPTELTTVYQIYDRRVIYSNFGTIFAN